MNFNRRLGRCMKDGVPCQAGRLHVCDVCGEKHRSCDNHWPKKDGNGNGTRFKSDKGKKSRR